MYASGQISVKPKPTSLYFVLYGIHNKAPFSPFQTVAIYCFKTLDYSIRKLSYLNDRAASQYMKEETVLSA